MQILFHSMRLKPAVINLKLFTDSDSVLARPGNNVSIC